MAQTGYTPISLYYSTTASAAPTAGNLVAGELAINTLDGKLFYKDSAGVVQTIASKGTGTIGGSTTQVQYNNAGSFAGSANMTFDGTNLTLLGSLGVGAAPITATNLCGSSAPIAVILSPPSAPRNGRNPLLTTFPTYNGDKTSATLSTLNSVLLQWEKPEILNYNNIFNKIIQFSFHSD